MLLLVFIRKSFFKHYLTVSFSPDNNSSFLITVVLYFD